MVGEQIGLSLSYLSGWEAGMLVLSRKIGETIKIGKEIDLVVLDVSRGRVKLGFAGPRNVQVRRGELADGTRAPEPAADGANGSMPVRACAEVPSNPPLRSFREAAAGLVG